LDGYEKTIVRTEDKDQFNQVRKAREAYDKACGQVLQLSQNSKEAEAQEFIRATLRPLYAAYLKECDGLFAENSKFGSAAAAAGEQAMSLANTLMVTLAIAGIFLGMLFSSIIVKGVSRVLNHVAGALDDGSNQVSSAASQVSSSSQSLAEGASEQASSLEETGSSLEEMTSMTKRNAENAKQANELARQAREAADKGVGDMQTMAAAMEAIKASSNDIAKIIKTIDEIAFQTNLLALNAAVEAARAGEAGMGFAVVADEVRNLAQRCAQAAKETAGKIEGAIAKTSQGGEISSKVALALNEIVAKVRKVDELVTEVANASREQTEGIAQINVAVGQMDKVTQGNAATAEESAAAAEELNAQAKVMKQSVAELLELVGGKSESAAKRPAVHARRIHEFHSPAPSARRSDPDNSNGNGHGHAAPGLAPAANRRNEIPLDGDFKDF
jgi:methyl-accepting chemotaxis protein